MAFQWGNKCSCWVPPGRGSLQQVGEGGVGQGPATQCVKGTLKTEVQAVSRNLLTLEANSPATVSQAPDALTSEPETKGHHSY